MPLPAILAGLGAAAAHPLGQAAISFAAPLAFNKISNWMSGPNPDAELQQLYRQQLQQPTQLNTQQRQQQLMNQFNQQILPGIREQFSGLGAGGQRSSAFGQQLGSAGVNLATNLGALGEDSALQEAMLKENRLGQLGGYLSGQQQLGLQGSIANRDALLRQMGLMQNYALGREGNDISRMQALGNVLGGLQGAGLRGQFDTINRPGQAAGGEELLMNALRAYFGRG